MNYSSIAKKWQKRWKENGYFEASNKSELEKYYILVEFPYPSGAGLHVGHVKSYSALDAMARMKRMQGFNVLFPMGWDAFGLPAEQYAIKNKVHPSEAVHINIETFKSQLEKLGMSFDWSREFSTTDPDYYKWTQWQFLKFVEHNMAYKDKKEINWCPSCKIGLSNEEAEGGVCERCGSSVVKKEKEQWILKMSEYSEKLLTGLDETEFIDRIKVAQRNWIGKSTGAEVLFSIKDIDEEIAVFTTRADTLFGATFLVLSPEHNLLDKYSSKIKNLDEIIEYQKMAKSKSEIERTDLTKEKTGVKILGLEAINPINNESIDIWISDYVLTSYGTGAIMAVPAHDDRDYEFANKFDIPVKQVLSEVVNTTLDINASEEKFVALVYDEFLKKYLVLFIEGVVEQGVSVVQSARTLIKKSTGLDNLDLVKEGFKISAYNEKQDFYNFYTPILFKFSSEDKNNSFFEDLEKYGLSFVDGIDIKKNIAHEIYLKVFEYLEQSTAMTGEGIHINSKFLDGLNKADGIKKTIEFLESKKVGRAKVNYKLQDWIFSRQRFWGEPIPMINCEDCGWVSVPYEDLPVVLPNVASYEPTDDGESPLANISEFVNCKCPKCGKNAKRETDTMPNWAGSSWYYLRYMDPHNDKEFVGADKLKYWNMVDYYNGGMEHATRHLLYARFWHRFFYDIGEIPYPEPFKKRVAHGMILGENHEKMSKSKGNVVNPDDAIEAYGVDALRVYELFIGDYEKDASWSDNGLKGAKRFIDKVIRIKDKVVDTNEESKFESLIHKTIKKVGSDLASMNYNTAVSSLMILANELDKEDKVLKKDYEILITLLYPMAPHTTEELNELIGNEKCIAASSWPIYNEDKTIENEVTIGVQVNGKLRSTILVSKEAKPEDLIKKAKENDNVKRFIESKEIIKEIAIPGKIVNLVVR